MIQYTEFLKCDNAIVPVGSVASIDTRDVANLIVSVITVDGKSHQATGILAVELLMQTRPGVMEGKRLRWPRRAWVLHNLVGHPLMQLLALVGLYGLAMKVHEGTVPRPVGTKGTT